MVDTFDEYILGSSSDEEIVDRILEGFECTLVAAFIEVGKKAREEILGHEIEEQLNIDAEALVIAAMEKALHKMIAIRSESYGMIH